MRASVCLAALSCEGRARLLSKLNACQHRKTASPQLTRVDSASASPFTTSEPITPESLTLNTCTELTLTLARAVSFSDLPIELVHNIIHQAAPTAAPSYSSLPVRYREIKKVCLVKSTFNVIALELLHEHLLLPSEAAARRWLRAKETKWWGREQVNTVVKSVRFGRTALDRVPSSGE